MDEKIFTFILVLTRVSTFFLLLPVFGWTAVPVRIKVAVTVVLSVFFSAMTTVPAHPEPLSAVKVVILMSNEAVYGLCLGLVLTIMFSAVKVAGQIIEREMGLSIAEVIDPLTAESSNLLGSLFEMIFIIIFLAANGHHFFLLIISRSYDAFPIGSIPTIPMLAAGITKAGSAMFVAGLRLGAPVLAALLLMSVILAILARIVPEMNILFISLPLRVGVGLLMVIVMLPFISTFTAEFADFTAEILPLR
ncbi:MAG TPA: flagellar biosynthetic protein FliR [Sedimentisphaerales bacterium]|nr:flagellar biosynthetic protein FliR [Sedimentisphaerales bacterium]